MFFFQIPWIPEWVLRRSDLGFLEASFRDCRAFTPDDLEAFKFIYSQPSMASTNPTH